ncbi:MAG: hypothetical protein HGA85_06095 [Nanoarchaeota archaeon]|nr:hypothetical protein [Nanoarchaeota archaeon]
MQPYFMSLRADEYTPKGYSPGVVSDMSNNDHIDPQISRLEAIALQNVKRKDAEFMATKFESLVNWAGRSGYYGSLLEYDKERETLYMVKDTKGTSLDQAVMYTIPKAELMTRDGRRIPVSILASPLEYETKISGILRGNKMADTAENRAIAEEYVFTHEHMHILSTMNLLSQNTLIVEGTTDFMLMEYFVDRMNHANKPEDKARYQKLAKIAEARVQAYQKQGYQPPN